jgi:hypothetical protein
LGVKHFITTTYVDSDAIARVGTSIAERGDNIRPPIRTIRSFSEEEVTLKRYITRAAAWALSVTLGLGAAVVPCAAADQTGQNTKAAPQLTRLSPASKQMLARAATPSRQQTAPATSSGSFFKTKKGAAVLALMGAGVGFATWSAFKDNNDVHSAVR